MTRVVLVVGLTSSGYVALHTYIPPCVTVELAIVSVEVEVVSVRTSTGVWGWSVVWC